MATAPKKIEITDEEVKRAQEVMAEVARRAHEAAEAAKKKVVDDAEEAYKRDYAGIKEWIKKGHDNPGRLAAELKISVSRVEAILRKISRELQEEKEKQFLKIPGIPS